MNQHKIIEYFSKRLLGIIRFQEYLEEVRINFSMDESYGEDYYRVYFDVDLNNKFHNLPEEEIERINHYFSDSSYTSGHKFISFHINKYDRDNDIYLRQLKNFYDSYTILCSFLSEVVGSLVPSSKLKISSLESSPEFNYLIKYWSDVTFTQNSYEEFYGRKFSDDYSNYFKMLEAAVKHKKNIKTKTVLISDYELSENYFWLKVKDIRAFVIDHDIPFSLKGGKTADELHIDVVALKKKIKQIQHFNPQEARSMQYAIDRHILHTNDGESQKQLFLEQYAVHVNDFILLKNNEKVLQITNIDFYGNSVWIYYLEINNNLFPGKRVGSCPVNNISKVLTFSEYNAQMPENGWKYRNQLVRLLKKQPKITLKNFQLK